MLYTMDAMCLFSGSDVAALQKVIPKKRDSANFRMSLSPRKLARRAISAIWLDSSHTKRERKRCVLFLLLVLEMESETRPKAQSAKVSSSPFFAVSFAA